MFYKVEAPAQTYMSKDWLTSLNCTSNLIKVHNFDAFRIQPRVMNGDLGNAKLN